MARQSGILKFKGTMGGVTFYKSSLDGHLAREKGGVEASRIANDPAFQRTRENGAEFGRAGNASKVLKTSIRPLLLNSADSRMTSRLTKLMVKVLQADTTSERGSRNVIDGEAVLLEGFEFNIRGTLGSSLFAPYTTTIDRATGTITLDVPQFIAANMLAAPRGTTHFKIISAGMEIDFEGQTYVCSTSESVVMPWDSTLTPAVTQSNVVTANSIRPLFLVVGIEFYQMVNGNTYPLKNGAYNPLSLVKVDGGV